MYPLIKRTLDIAIALIGIVLTFPVLCLLAVLIKTNTTGPAVYASERVGKDGKPFRLYKFRTMVVNADTIGGPSAGDDDPRITRVGRILRKYKLDEFPQLANVIKGDMSFVGPRPEVRQEVDLYSGEEKAILSIRPGITDYASIKFNNEGEILAGSEDPHQVYLQKIRPEKMRLGLEYVKNRSLWVDTKIMAKTITTLIGSRLK